MTLMSGEGIRTGSDVKKTSSNSELLITSLAAGAIAGAIAKTTIAPLDRTKINFQIRKGPYSAREAVRFLLETRAREGFFALWRGNTATLARIVPYAAFNFAAYEQWKRVLRIDDLPKEQSHKSKFLAGSLAGVTSQTLTYPLDLARARMAVTDKNEYSTLRQVFVKIWYEEGPRTFYRGYIPTMLGVIPYAGVSFYTYDTLKNAWRERVRIDSPPGPIELLAFGAVAGVLGQTSSYPLDILRRRMQTSRLGDAGVERTIVATMLKIYREEGVCGGFFKGLSMNWIKGPIAVGVSFASYDKICEFLREVVLANRRA